VLGKIPVQLGDGDLKAGFIVIVRQGLQADNYDEKIDVN
jgi:hypothetical protein